MAERTRQPLKRMWSSRLVVPLRPAAAGPVRYWQDQVRLAVKAAIAAVGAWALARYVAGFLLGVALAIPAGLLLGPEIAAIAIVVIGGVLISGWQRLGDQGTQVTFTALFVLLLGGHQPLHYVTHRMVDVGIGVATGLAVNVVVFPPLQLRPAEHAIRQWGESIARALEDLSGAAADLDADTVVKSWPRHDRQLSEAARRARAATRNARESLRWNPRARATRGVPRPDGAVLDSLEELTARTRAVARSLPDIAAADRPGEEGADRTDQDQASFGENYAALLRSLADPVRQLADLRTSRPRATLAAARDCQRQLESQAARRPDHSDVKSAARHLVRLSGDILGEVAEHHGAIGARAAAES